MTEDEFKKLNITTKEYIKMLRKNPQEKDKKQTSLNLDLEAKSKRGGTRPNAGRPKLPEHIRKHKVNFWITLQDKEFIREIIKLSTLEKEMIKRFIMRIREEM